MHHSASHSGLIAFARKDWPETTARKIDTANELSRIIRNTPYPLHSIESRFTILLQQLTREIGEDAVSLFVIIP